MVDERLAAAGNVSAAGSILKKILRDPEKDPAGSPAPVTWPQAESLDVVNMADDDAIALLIGAQKRRQGADARRRCRRSCRHSTDVSLNACL